PFAPALPSLLAMLCTQAAISLENATLYGNLAEANRVLDAAFDELPSGLVLLHPDLTVRRASARCEEILGRPLPPGTPLQRIFDDIKPTDADGRPLAVEAGLARDAVSAARVIHREVR